MRPASRCRAENGEIVAAHGEGAENIRAAFALVAELDEVAAANFVIQDAATLASAYQKALRKRAKPMLLPLESADAGRDRARAVRQLLQGRDGLSSRNMSGRGRRWR